MAMPLLKKDLHIWAYVSLDFQQVQLSNCRNLGTLLNGLCSFFFRGDGGNVIHMISAYTNRNHVHGSKFFVAFIFIW